MRIVGADAIIDGVGELSETDAIREWLTQRGARVEEFSIASIREGWHSVLPIHCLRGACAPIEIFCRTRELFAERKADAVVIQGKDFLRTDFRGREEERNKLMHIYDDGKVSIVEAYERCAQQWVEHWGISKQAFFEMRDALFENHLRVWKGNHPEEDIPQAKWFSSVTEFFRGVDCANPNIDFKGCVVVVNSEFADELGERFGSMIEIVGCHVEQDGEDSLESIEKIVGYEHLKEAYEACCREAGVDFFEIFQSREAFLEVYSCFPVVPLGFLFATGFVSSPEEAMKFLQLHPMTMTGGLNLAKAPGNLTTLFALVKMVRALREPQTPNLGGIHSISSIGHKQAFAILRK